MNPDIEICRCGSVFDDDGSIIEHQLSECIYERCDERNCRALKLPVTLADYQTAWMHWKHHRHLSGCSHGH